ncbi:MAG: VIT domain-containing protein [Candidatus Heimdallarchaeota archaeon]
MRKKGLLFVLALLALTNSTIFVKGVPVVMTDTGILPIRTQRVNVLIDNGYVVTNVSQEFYNPHDVAVQGTYLFAIPEEAFISNFSLTIEGVKHYGTILPREQAREQYQVAVEAGRTAGLLEYVGRKLFTYGVSLAPDDIIEVELVYEQFLRKRFNSYMYIHPLETKEFDAEVESLIMNIDIRSQSAISNIHVQGYDFDIDEKSTNRVQLHYSEENILPETDLVLTYDVAAFPDKGTLLVANKDGTNYFMYVFAPVLEGVDVVSLPKDVIFVMDKSGSMDGDKIEQTQEAMHNILPQLNPTDRFTIVFYDSIIRTYSKELLLADNSNIENALTFVDSLTAGGSTDINQALLVALDTFPSTDRLKIIVFLTDGLPTAGVVDEPEIVGNIADANAIKAVKIYSFGFGWDVNMDLLDQISTGNHGEATRIHPTQNIKEQLSNFFQTIATPLLKDISIDYGGTVKDTFPKEIPTLFNGSEIIVVGQYYGENPMSITVRAESEQGQKIFIGEFDISDPSRMHPFAPKLWATQKINYLLDHILLEGETTPLIEEIVQLSIEYGIVTPYTSILIDPESIQGEISQEEVLGEEASEAALMAPSPGTTPPGTTPSLTTYADTNIAEETEKVSVSEVMGKEIFLFLGLLSLLVFAWRRKRKI